MRLSTKVSGLALAIAVACGIAQVAPSVATATPEVSVAPQSDVRSVATVSSVQDGGVTAADEISQRINQLVAAYDHETGKVDASRVAPEVLNSEEGQAFLAAVSLTESAETTAELEAAFVKLRDSLLEADGSMSLTPTGSGAAVTFQLTPGTSITYPTTLASGGSQGSGVRALVTGGADPFPYIQLTNAEQQAMVTGASGALVGAICALLAPTTAGVGCGVGAAVIAMIVGIIMANGVCANNREMRIYPLAGPSGFSCQ